MDCCASFEYSCIKCISAGCSFIKQRAYPWNLCVGHNNENGEKITTRNLQEWYAEIKNPETCEWMEKWVYTRVGAYLFANLNTILWLFCLILTVFSIYDEMNRQRKREIKRSVVSNYRDKLLSLIEKDALCLTLLALNLVLLLLFFPVLEWKRLIEIQRTVISNFCNTTTWLLCGLVFGPACMLLSHMDWEQENLRPGKRSGSSLSSRRTTSSRSSCESSCQSSCQSSFQSSNQPSCQSKCESKCRSSWRSTSSSSSRRGRSSGSGAIAVVLVLLVVALVGLAIAEWKKRRQNKRSHKQRAKRKKWDEYHDVSLIIPSRTRNTAGHQEEE